MSRNLYAKAPAVSEVDAVEAELRLWEPQIQSWARFFHKTMPWEEVEDLEQVARLGVLARLRTWEARPFSPDHPESWRNRVVRNVLTSHFRSMNPRRVVSTPMSTLPEDEVQAAVERLEAVSEDSNPLVCVEEAQWSNALAEILTEEEFYLLECKLAGGKNVDFYRDERYRFVWEEKAPKSEFVAKNHTLMLLRSLQVKVVGLLEAEGSVSVAAA